VKKPDVIQKNELYFSKSKHRLKSFVLQACVIITPVIMLISTALLLDSNIRNSVCTPAKLPCRRVAEGLLFYNIFYIG
jgi:hypothetical protein